MKTVLNYQDYIVFLKDVFFDRSCVLENYTIADFAEEIGLDRSHLNQILNDKKGISEKMAYKVGATLFENDSNQIDHFVSLITAKHARSKVKRDLARKQVFSNLQKIGEISGDEFSFIGKWYYFAILASTLILDIPVYGSLEELVRFLGLPKNLVSEALEELVQREYLIDQKGYWKTNYSYITTKSPTPSKVIQNFHKQILKLGEEALENQDINERQYSSTIMAISKDKLEDAKKMLLQFDKEFNKEIVNSEETKDSLYCLSYQFFRLNS